MLINWHAEYAQLRGLWRKHPVLYAKQRLGLDPDMAATRPAKGYRRTRGTGYGAIRSFDRQKYSDGRGDLVGAGML